ncbi:MAG: GNAT family N-acetyltransferase [Bacteroidota bacterium]
MRTQINEACFQQFPKLESKRLYYRAFEPSDAPQMLAIRSNAQVMRYMDTTPFKSEEEALQMIQRIQQKFQEQKGINWVLMEKNSQAFIGYFGFWRIQQAHCRGEIGYALLPDFWARGYMKEAMNTLIRFGFDQLWLHSIEANVNPANQRSIRLLERTGFVKEAYYRENYLYNNQFLDSVIYGLLERDLTNA